MTTQKVAGCPFEYSDVPPEEISDVLDLFKGITTHYIRIGPKGYFSPKGFENDLGAIYNMPLRPTDIFVTSYQRSGTTWTQELVWLVENNLDYEKAGSMLLTQRFPFLDLIMFLNDKAKQMFIESMGGYGEEVETVKNMLKPATEILATTPDPRFVKTHLPFSLLPPTLVDTAKVVYVARDPRDVAVSAYHHTKLFAMMGFTGDFKQFWTLFIQDKFTLTPYFEHVKEAWALRNHPNMLFLFYEDLRKDLKASVYKVLNFLGKQQTQEQIAKLCEHLSIETFRNNKSVNAEELRQYGLLDSNESFIRTGKAGGWRDYFDEEMTQDAKRWILDNLRGTDLRFPSMTDIDI